MSLLVLAADVRHSSLLMKEAVDPYRFASTLGGFIKRSRGVVWESRGWFDKFTGDGLLAYWPYTEGTKNSMLLRVFGAVRRLLNDFDQTYVPQFAANSQNYPEQVRLAVGLDDGYASLVTIADEPTIVGPAVVGAVRMVEAVGPWDVLANVHLGYYVANEVGEGRLTGVEASLVSVVTKEYEQQAYFLSFH